MDATLRDRWLERAEQRLAGAGLRAGAARTAVVELLAREGQCLLSAQEVTDRLRPKGVGSAASVYRVLDELFELGLLHRLDGRDGIARYEIADPERHHHHVVDERSGEVQPFTDERLEEAIAAVGDRLGMRLTSHEVILRGVPDRTSSQG
ncbi:MAG TPA: transcriptional repressor [Solirubrobacteraceae bacterium]|nr:transcriptional repressor [Solirubrobacteraceae bacterium]